MQNQEEKDVMNFRFSLRINSLILPINLVPSLEFLIMQYIDKINC